MATCSEVNTPLVAEPDPLLWPHMLVPRPRPSALSFPFRDPSVQYCYFARNGIFEVARLFGLDGQEVLFPAYFHGVELEALLAAGARPRIYAVRAGMRVEPEDVIERITPETKAIYLIHYAGFPGPVEELRDVCRARNLLLIEDCALALLSCLGSKPLGSFGDAAVFCLYKTLPVPNGGAVILRSDKWLSLNQDRDTSRAATAQLVAHSLVRNLELQRGAMGRFMGRGAHAIGRGVASFGKSKIIPVGTQTFERSHLGLAMSSTSHRLLKTQDYAGIVERRRRNYSRLLDSLADVAPSVLGELPDGICPLFYPIQVQDKLEVMRHFRARGFATVNVWAFHHPIAPAGAFPEVDELRRTVLELPCHQDLSLAAVDRLATAVRAVMKEVA